MITRHALFACLLVGTSITLAPLGSGCSSSKHTAAGAGGSNPMGSDVGGAAPNCACGQTSVQGVPCATFTPCTDGGTIDQCECACLDRVTASGCANVCSASVMGGGGAPPTPNFCEGQAPSAACTTCLAERCPQTPTAPGTCTNQ